MAKYGRFAFGQQQPHETYEADYMQQEKEYIRLFKFGPDGVSRLVVAINLDKGQSVREIG